MLFTLGLFIFFLGDFMRTIKHTMNKNEGCTAKVINPRSSHVADKAKKYMHYIPYSSSKTAKVGDEA